MADFRAERHRRQFGEQYGPRQEKLPERASGRSLPWPELVRSVRAYARARLHHLQDRKPTEVITCPRVVRFRRDCDRDCSVCGGSQAVTVGALVDHYRAIVAELLP